MLTRLTEGQEDLCDPMLSLVDYEQSYSAFTCPIYNCDFGAPIVPVVN